ncbi:hypothetical protein DX130_12190 [Paenibacillus paeoniae]|uniref:Thioredoxin domain-containing protein n=1 Tax=Paenibacillus paeoniae TaxID=2292705 RepID=A0A371PP63_9BACL|nr:hypothetical protein DX130_12190 [Paenibacillus paeoniae]
MGTINFKELFQRNTLLDNEYKIGDFLPESITLLHPNSDNPVLLAYISLTCKSCVDMLPTLIPAFNTYPGYVQLFTDGNQEENRELSHHFQPNFPILSLSPDEQRNVHKVFATPFLYRLNNNRVIQDCGIIHSIHDLNRIINQS